MRNLGIGALIVCAGLALVGKIPVLLGTVGLADPAHDASVVSVFEGFIPQRDQAAIRAGTSTYDATNAIQRAIAAVAGSGRTLRIPAGTYYVRELVFGGRNYTVETAGVTFRQKPGLTGDHGIHPIILFPAGSSDIRLGNLRLEGNIATDRDEYSHGIAVLSADNITLGNVYGKDIRGDVLYTYGRTTSAPEYQRNLVAGVISGNNVYRSIVAMAGGEARIAGIEQEGAVGYRDLDIEPSPGGAYQPVNASFGRVRGSSVQITSGDPQTINTSVAIEQLELDGDRIANPVPNYPGFQGRNAIALAINHTDTVKIGSLVLRNYDSYPVQLADKWRSIRIGTLDFANSDTREQTYKTIVLQYGTAGSGVLAIERIQGALAGPDRFAIRSDRGLLRVDVGTAAVAGGSLGAYLTGSVREFARDSRTDAHRLCAVGCRHMRLGSATVVE